MTRKQFFAMVVGIITAPFVFIKKTMKRNKSGDIILPIISPPHKKVEVLNIPFRGKGGRFNKMSFPVLYRPGIDPKSDYVIIVTKKDKEIMCKYYKEAMLEAWPLDYACGLCNDNQCS